MVVPCSSEILFDHPCEYRGTIDLDDPKVAYSVRKMSGKEFYYHYLCYERQSTELVALRPKHKKRLCEYLLNLRASGNSENWINGVLFACGVKSEVTV